MRGAPAATWHARVSRRRSTQAGIAGLVIVHNNTDVPVAACHVSRVPQEKNTQTKLALQLREELTAVRQDLSKERKQRAEAERVRGTTRRHVARDTYACLCAAAHHPHAIRNRPEARSYT